MIAKQEKQKQHKILKNENLMANCISYLKPKDLSQVGQANKKLNKLVQKYNFYWLKECQDYFCSTYENTSFYDTDYTKESKSDKYSNICTFSWKKHFRMGLDIMINFNKLTDCDSSINDEVSNDISALKEELYSSLKEQFNCPILRKENPYVESSLNSTFQKYLFEFLYQQRDLYMFYDNQLKEKINNKKILKSLKEISVNVKNKNLIFSSLLEKLSEVVKDLNTPNLISEFYSLRWYQLETDFTKYNKSLFKEDKAPLFENIKLDLNSHFIKNNSEIIKQEAKEFKEKEDYYFNNTKEYTEMMKLLTHSYSNTQVTNNYNTENNNIKNITDTNDQLEFKKLNSVKLDYSNISNNINYYAPLSNSSINDKNKKFLFGYSSSSNNTNKDQDYENDVNPNMNNYYDIEKKIGLLKLDSNISNIDYLSYKLNKQFSNISNSIIANNNYNIKSSINNQSNQNSQNNNCISLKEESQQNNNSIISSDSVFKRDFYSIKYRSKVELNKEILEEKQSSNKPAVIFILNSIILTLTHFCKSTFHFLNSIRGAEPKVLLNEYYKRYAAYLDAAITMNASLENLNVVVNYCYEYIFTGANNSPKFSIFRLFMITWNREVLMKLFTNKNNHILIEKIAEIYEKEITYEFYSKLNDYIKSNSNGNGNDCSKNEMNNIDISSINNMNATSLTDYLNNCIKLSESDKENIEEVLNNYNDEDNSFNFLQNFISMIIDSSLHEYSVYKSNHSDKCSINMIAKEIITKMQIINTEFIRKHYLNFSNMFLYNNSKILLSFLLETIKDTFSYSLQLLPAFRKQILEDFYKNFFQVIVEEILIKKKNKTCLINNISNPSNTCNNNKNSNSYDSSIELSNLSSLIKTKEYISEVVDFMLDFISSSSDTLDDQSHCIYKDLKKHASEIIELLDSIRSSQSEIKMKDSYSDVEIEKELKRRNIPCNFSEKEEICLSFMNEFV